MKSFVALAFLCAVGGCSSKNSVKTGPNASQQLNAIGRAYIKYTDDEGHPPQKKEDLIPLLPKMRDPDNPEAEPKAPDPVQFFRSPNDGEDFVILWGVDFRGLNLSVHPSKLPVIAYEKTGKDGKRLVLQVRYVNSVTDEQFEELPFPPGFKRP